MTDNGFIVQSAIPERLYVKIYHDFLDSTIINGKEKMVFILLKRYLNFKYDESGIAGEVYPTLETLSKQAGMSRKTVADIIKKLEIKGLIEVKQQGLNRPNIYTLRDFSGIWKSKTEEELKEAVESYDNDIEDFVMIQKLRSKGWKITKEKEPDTSQADQSNDESSTKLNQFDIVNTTPNSNKSQEKERYTLEEIKLLYNYDIMITDNPFKERDINSVIDILHTTLNTTKETVRIGGEDKPAMVVISKLMKLDYSEIMYAIDKFTEQTERIKNPTAYMLTLLYNAKEQMNLDISNQVQHDMYNWQSPTE